MESTLYERIRMLCEKKGISIAKLENDCGFANSTIKKWKSTSTPGVDKIKVIARYFGVTVDYILGLTDIPTPADTPIFVIKSCNFTKSCQASNFLLIHDYSLNRWITVK